MFKQSIITGRGPINRFTSVVALATAAVLAMSGCVANTVDSSEARDEVAGKVGEPLSAGAFRISLDSDPRYALYAMDGVANDSRIGVTTQCTDSDIRCKFIFRKSSLVSAANPSLAITAAGPRVEGTELRLRTCVGSDASPDCLWAYGYGIFVVNHGDASLGVLGPLANGTPVKLRGGATFSSWTFQHAVISFDSNPSLHWFASGGGVAGSTIKLKPCAATDPNCTWTVGGYYNWPISWTHISSDSNPALQVGHFTSNASEAPLSLKSCVADDLQCNYFFQQGYGQISGVPDGVVDTLSSAHVDGAAVVAGTWTPTRDVAITIGPGDTSSVPAKPCDQLCTNPKAFLVPPSYQSGAVGAAAGCYETTSALQGGNCNNPGNRSVTVNGTRMSCGNNWPTLPAKRAGGYCVQVSAAGAGDPTWTAFATW